MENVVSEYVNVIENIIDAIIVPVTKFFVFNYVYWIVFSFLVVIFLIIINGNIKKLNEKINEISKKMNKEKIATNKIRLIAGYKDLVDEKIINKNQFDEYKEKIIEGKISKAIDIDLIKECKDLYKENYISKEEYNKYIEEIIKKAYLIKIEIFYTDRTHSREEIKVSEEKPSMEEIQEILKENGCVKQIKRYNILESKKI